MKVFIIFVVIYAVAANGNAPNATSGATEPPLNSTPLAKPNQQPSAPAPSAPAPAARNGRYILLQNGGVYDTIYDLVIPSNAQYVIQQGSGGNRDIYLRTVPLTTVRREYVVTA